MVAFMQELLLKLMKINGGTQDLEMSTSTIQRLQKQLRMRSNFSIDIKVFSLQKAVKKQW